MLNLCISLVSCSAAVSLALAPVFLRRPRTPDQLRSVIDYDLHDHIAELFTPGRHLSDEMAWQVVRASGGWGHLTRQARILVKLSFESAKEGQSHEVCQVRKTFALFRSAARPGMAHFFHPERKAALAVSLFADIAVLWEGITIDAATS
jgi:hypothetical protein